MTTIRYWIVAVLVVWGLCGTFAQEKTLLQFDLEDCRDSVFLYQFQGMDLEPAFRTLPDTSGSGQFLLPKGEPAIYFLGQSRQSTKALILGPEDEVVVRGSCRDMREAEVVVSDLNMGYQNLLETISEFNQRTGRLFTLVRRAQEKSEREAAIEQVKGLDQEKTAILEVMKADNPFLYKIMALNTYISYFSDAGDYSSEIEYYANELFQFVDFSDPGYNGIYWLHQNVNRYAQTLLSVPMGSGKQSWYFDNLLDSIPTGTVAHSMALGGIVAAAEAKKSPLFPAYAKQFMSLYGLQLPRQAADLSKRVQKATRFSVGAKAPDFSQETPDGELLKLSDLRGKYVLLDFWASWCGPCRRENPNVVKLYNQYKDAGFTILGVSLDRNRERWLKAIDDDGLDWHHVSDLKGWQNEVAQMYEVRGIPRTLLLDPEGKIIGKDLRGESLRNTLSAIFEDQ